MSQSSVATLFLRSVGAVRLLHSLVNALHGARVQQARGEIARHAELLESALRLRSAREDRAWEWVHD